MLNRASQSPIPPLNTNVGVAPAVVAVIVEGTADFPELERKHLEKPGMLNLTKEQPLKTRALSLLGGAEETSLLFSAWAQAVWLLLSVGGGSAGRGRWMGCLRLRG